MAQAIPLVQGLTELPLVIDSSVIEALEAGLAAYDGKALVNSVTGEDARLRGDPADRRQVRRRGDRTRERRRDPDGARAPARGGEEDRLVAGDYGIPPEDIVIDPLAMPVGAEPRAVTLFLETLAADA